MNIGSTNVIDIKTLATAIRDQIDPSLDLEDAERYSADADHTQADITKAREDAPAQTAAQAVHDDV